jgi:hypothetical protein
MNAETEFRSSGKDARHEELLERQNRLFEERHGRKTGSAKAGPVPFPRSD